MASFITAGNATNGLQVSSDNTGILELKTGTGSGTTALTLSTGQNATFAGTVQVAGVSTSLYPLVSGTSQTASSTSVDFTGIPSWVKRITVMFNSTSLNASGSIIVQVGSGSFSTSGYAGVYGYYQNAASSSALLLTTGFGAFSGQGAAAIQVGTLTLTNVSGNIWVSAMNGANSDAGVIYGGNGVITLGGVLDRVRITTVAGTAQFDAGTLNILYE